MATLNIQREPDETEDEWERRYAREYYKANKQRWADCVRDPQRVRATKRAYYAKNRERIKAAVKARRDSNPEAERARGKARYQKNLVKNKMAKAAYYAANAEKIMAKNKRYRAENDDAWRAYKARWCRENLPKINAASARRAARERLACPSWADMKAIEAVYAEAKRLEKETGIPHHVDHIVPIAGKTVCGLHIHQNLRAIPAVENLSKRNKLTEEALVLCRALPSPQQMTL